MPYRLARGLLALLALMAVAGCGSDAAPAPAPPAAAAAPAEEAPAVAPDAAAEDAGFDIARVPLSDAPLGEFPYLALPRGYHSTERLRSEFPREVFPFWVGDRYIAVEGRLHLVNLRADEGRNFSALEVAGNLEHLMRQAGAVPLASGVVPRAASGPVLTREFTRKFANGLCWPTEPLATWVIRRTDRDIWVQGCTYGGIGGAWVVAETAAPEPTATLLPANELRSRIDAEGRVALRIHFASDSARLLAGAQPQLDQVVELLQGLPELALAVEGHTDDTGSAERNRALSAARAAAVVAVLVERGIAPGRLEARGIGREAPLQGNDTPEGRAANRRVELVRI